MDLFVVREPPRHPFAPRRQRPPFLLRTILLVFLVLLLVPAVRLLILAMHDHNPFEIVSALAGVVLVVVSMRSVIRSRV